MHKKIIVLKPLAKILVNCIRHLHIGTDQRKMFVSSFWLQKTFIHTVFENQPKSLIFWDFFLCQETLFIIMQAVHVFWISTFTRILAMILSSWWTSSVFKCIITYYASIVNWSMSSQVAKIPHKWASFYPHFILTIEFISEESKARIVIIINLN